jgi:hypothetical protein
MRNIPPLYHWSPTSARASIRRQGLLPTCPSGRIGLAVCLATTPLMAWRLSKSSRELVGDGPWDLWEVYVADTPVSRVRHHGRLIEYRIPRTIGSSGLQLIATRGKDGP